MKTTTLATLLLAMSLSTQPSLANINAIEAAAMTLNTAELITLSNNHSGYQQALANYRLAITQELNGNIELAIKQLNIAITTLEVLTTENANDSETWALLAQVYGLKIAYQPMKAVYYGPKSSSALNKALTLNPKNPRAHLVNGISKYNTPALFGGSKVGAITAFDKAIALYQDEKNSEYNWGEAEAHIWRGLSNIEINKPSQAIRDWQQALVIAPNHGWAKMLLAANNS